MTIKTHSRYYAVTCSAIQRSPSKIITSTILTLSASSLEQIHDWFLLECVKEWPTNDFYGHYVGIKTETDSQREDLLAELSQVK